MVAYSYAAAHPRDVTKLVLRQDATNVTSVVFPDSGRWIYEEHPGQSAKLLLAFLG